MLLELNRTRQYSNAFILQRRITMRFFAMTCLFFLCINTTLANPLNNTPLSFDIKKANQQFDHINLQLSVQNLNVNNLDSAVNKLEALTEQSDDFVTEIQKKLNNINILIKQGGGSASSTTGKEKEGADLVYLQTQQKELADQQAQCRLFSIRAKEAIEAYKTAIAELKQEQALTRGMPLWKIISQTIDSPPETNFLNLLTTKISAAFPPFLSCFVIICAAFFSSIITLRRMKSSRFSRNHLRFKKNHLSYLLLLTSTFIAASLFIYFLILFQEFTMHNLPPVLSGIVFLYLISVVLILFLFKIKNVIALFYWYSLDYSFFQSVSITLLSFYATASVGQLFATSFNANNPLWQLCESLFLLLILSTGAYFIHSFCKIHNQFAFIKNHHSFITNFSALLIVSCAIINVLGYITLAQHLTSSIFVTCAIIFITILITHGINKLYLMLNQQQATKLKLIKYFGYKADQVFTEFLILKTVSQIIIIAISVYLIGQSWGFATMFIEVVYDQFINGVHLANATFYPTRIISGVVVFCSLYLVCRAISTAISRHQQFEEEEETQVAVASILNYVGFGLAMIVGFLVAGFNFTGLAIIAGALSVGIGLGLQSIVNNFVSGLILLIEKPIRPGDRINVDGLEGFVKKIRVRSTQIITPSREDIIVPNSDLITRPVINYMFSDKFCHINCEVGVAYGSDTHQVRDVLLDVACNNEEVVKTGRNKPTVLFRSFAENTLVFQLGCLIKDVNKKAIVQSELNFAIEKAFRENNIDMPFPQRDITIKLTDLAPLSKKMEKITPA